MSLLIGAGIAAFMAIGALGLGGIALWGDSQKDERGYISTDSERFGASTHALATENLDIDLDGAQGLVEATGFGDIRLDVAPQTGKPVFVGIARTDDVSAYLSGVSHTTVTDLDYEPFEASYSRQPGAGSPGRPAGERIWAASTQGAGPQTLEWEAEDGDWSVVVMNADGSRGVQADIGAGAKLPFLSEVGWSAIGGGALLLLAAFALAVLGIRPPRGGARGTPVTAPVPAAT
ncbi:MAG TPA: hypothetical protein VGW14_10490 [Thermoleophilaceae bacterium]|nr:hypothetical protein [Thermoleophilaceae bacterium]